MLAAVAPLYSSLVLPQPNLCGPAVPASSFATRTQSPALCTATPPKLDFMKLMDGESLDTPPPAAPVPVPEPPAPAPVAEAAPAAAADTNAADNDDDGSVKSWYDAGIRLDGSGVAPEKEKVKIKVKGPGPKQPSFDLETTGYEALTAALDGDGGKVLTSIVCEWGKADAASKAATLDKLTALESGFDKSQDPAAIKDLLVGSWKLLVADEADKVLSAGVSNQASEVYQRVVGQVQTFKKPSPEDIFKPAAERVFMETSEVVVDGVAGTSSTVSVKGGFQVGALTLSQLDVAELYSSREVDGAAQTEPDVPANSWSVTYLSAADDANRLRIGRSPDGKSMRVYAAVETAAAMEEITRLGGLDVKVDQVAVVRFQAAQEAKAKAAAAAAEGDDEDDPNDNRPLWQKRIDKADGIKRTKNGTPIINHGPIGGGPTLQS